MVAGEIAAPVCPVAVGTLELDGESDVRRGCARQRRLLQSEAEAGAVQLEQGNDRALDRDRNEPHDRQPCARRNPPHRGRCCRIAAGVLQLDLAGRRIDGGELRPLELGRERGRSGVDGAGYEAALFVRQPGDDELRAGTEGDRAQKRSKRALALIAANELERRHSEGLERAPGRLGRWRLSLLRG